MRLLLLSFCALLLVGRIQAQQTLCERGLGNPTSPAPYARLRPAYTLVATAPDSCLLHVQDDPANLAFGRRSRLVWVSRTTCDTARFAPLYTGASASYSFLGIVRRRRGDLLVAGTQPPQSNADSARVFLRSYSRQGTLLWGRTYRVGGPGPARYDSEGFGALLEAPDRGTYLTSGGNNGALSKLDSEGRVQWKRSLCTRTSDTFFANWLTYTVRGNLLLLGVRSVAGLNPQNLLLEVNQRGDSLTSRPVLPELAGRQVELRGLRRLQDGGFLVTASVDTTARTGGNYLPVLVRLDADLNVRWQRVVRSLRVSVGVYDLSRGGLELADGSLLLVVAPGGNLTVRLLHYSATGTLLHDYTYQSQYAHGGFTKSLAPLAADSSFVLADAPLTTYSTSIDHFRLPGLRRVLAEPGIPPAQVLAAHAPAAAFPALAFPNPAPDLATVPLPPGPGPGTLRLHDLTGRLVRQLPTPAGAQQVPLPLAGLAPGLYLLHFQRPGQPPASQRLAVGW